MRASRHTCGMEQLDIGVVNLFWLQSCRGELLIANRGMPTQVGDDQCARGAETTLGN